MLPRSPNLGDWVDTHLVQTAGGSATSAWYCLQKKRQVAVQEACRREIGCYAAKQETIEGTIAATEADIVHAEATLLAAQVLRSNLEEYEVILLQNGSTLQLLQGMRPL